MANSTIPVIKLTRSQIQEIVGPDQSKISVFESLIDSALVQDATLIEAPDGAPIDPIRVSRWGNGRMEMYPENPPSTNGGTVVFPIPFYEADVDPINPNITAGENFTISALDQESFTWTSTATTEHMWRVVGRWKE